MEHNELYGLLELPEEVIARLNAYEKSRKGAFRISFQELTENRELVQTLDKVIAEEIGEDEDGIGILWEELQIALQTFDEYSRKGIPTDIFSETMKFCT
ncbi:MAG: acyltransferase domain-containing protein, partial [Lachnospiraceae bacterium]|nr:acyltransferase domain-containing protein [Lachnospiraceae bacterium]